MTRSTGAILSMWIVLGLVGAGAIAQEPSLASHFGFEPLEVIRIGRQAGPMAVGDLDGDGLMDLLVVNNHASRLEMHYQKAGARRDDELPPPSRVNEFPEHWRFRRQNMSVSHRVHAVCLHDFNGDGRLDVVYGASPAAIVFIEQSPDGIFKVTARHTVRGLSARPRSLTIANIVGGPEPELIGIVKDHISIWPLDGAQLGKPRQVAASEEITQFQLADFDGNGHPDLAAMLPESAAPLRIWLSTGNDSDGHGLGPEHRFVVPAVQDVEPVHLPSEDQALLAMLERASKRIVVHALEVEQVMAAGNRDAVMEIRGFTDAGNRKRDHAVVDVNGDGLLDLVVTDTKANTIVVYSQEPVHGIAGGAPAPSYADVEYLVGGHVDDDPFAELFVLSKEEGVVGRIDVSGAGPAFPSPIGLREGTTPVAMNLVQLDGKPHLAVVTKVQRDYSLELISMTGDRETIGLGALSRAPQAIIAHDVDHDGRADLLLFTRDKPMTLLLARDDEFVLTESGDLGQFGLVQAANADNVAVFDVNGDGADELLIADRNYVRAVRVVTDPEPGVSPGWQVVTQVNVDDSSSKLVSLAVSGRHIIAADDENGRLVLIARHDVGTWRESESIRVEGFELGSIHAGAFGGDGAESILAINNDGFAVIRLSGPRLNLRQTEVWRSDDEQRFYHELATGDVNGDGLTDMVALDAREQSCDILTFSRTGRLFHALGFPVFESRLFASGEGRQYEPGTLLVRDVTGDGADDLVMVAHDRILIYPQMTAPIRRE